MPSCCVGEGTAAMRGRATNLCAELLHHRCVLGKFLLGRKPRCVRRLLCGDCLCFGLAHTQRRGTCERAGGPSAVANGCSSASPARQRHTYLVGGMQLLRQLVDSELLAAQRCFDLHTCLVFRLAPHTTHAHTGGRQGAITGCHQHTAGWVLTHASHHVPRRAARPTQSARFATAPALACG